MTTAEFLALPDRERDTLIADHVMGWTAGSADGNGYGLSLTGSIYREGKIWSPSRDIAAAWDVVEKFEALNLIKWQGLFTCYIRIDNNSLYAINEHAPLAICLAALKTMGFIE